MRTHSPHQCNLLLETSFLTYHSLPMTNTKLAPLLVVMEETKEMAVTETNDRLTRRENTDIQEINTSLETEVATTTTEASKEEGLTIGQDMEVMISQDTSKIDSQETKVESISKYLPLEL